MPNSWDGSLETKVNSIINSLGTHNSALLSVNFESTDDTSRLVVLNTVEISLINDDIAWYVCWLHSLESLHLFHDQFSIPLDSSWLYGFKETHICLPAADEKLSLHHFDESLDEEVLQKLLIGGLITLHFLSDLCLRLGSQFLNVFVNFAHSLDSHLILLL